MSNPLNKPPTADLANMRGHLPGIAGGALAALQNMHRLTTNLISDGIPEMRVLKNEFIGKVAHEALGLSSETSGVIRPDGTRANEDAMYLAREKTGRNKIVCSNLAHRSVREAASRLQMNVTSIDTNPLQGFQMSSELLLDALSDDAAALHITCGTTELGTIEQLDPRIAQYCIDAGVWVHLDAAYGGFNLGMLPDEFKQRRSIRSIAASPAVRSITIDPHKFIGPLDCSVLLLPHGDDISLRERMYLDGVNQISGTTRGAFSTLLTLDAMKQCGTSGMEELARQSLMSAQYLEKCLRTNGLNTIVPVQSGVVPVQLNSAAEAEFVYKKLTEHGFTVARPIELSGSSYQIHGIRFVITTETYWDVFALEDLARMTATIVRGYRKDCA